MRIAGANPSLCIANFGNTPQLRHNRGLRLCCLPTFLLSRELQNHFRCGALVAELISDFLYPMEVEDSHQTTGLLRWAAVMYGCWEQRPIIRKSFTEFVRGLEATVATLREETREYENDGVLRIK